MAYDTREEMLRALEAILFASGYPVKFDVIADVLGIDGETARELARELSDSCEGRGTELCFVGDACQLCSRAEYEEAVRAALGIRRGTKLSPALMEVLSIVAYRQPVTKAYIEQVRGVDCSYSITALLDRSMIENVGHLDLPGRPALYGTTSDFLRVFGISSLDELPPIELFDAVGGQNVGAVGGSQTAEEASAETGDADGSTDNAAVSAENGNADGGVDNAAISAENGNEDNNMADKAASTEPGDAGSGTKDEAAHAELDPGDGAADNGAADNGAED